MRATRTSRPQGLVASLSDLALASSLLAVCMPVVVMVVHLVTGHSLSSEPSSTELPGPLIAMAIASFVLDPMLALTGGAAALVVLGATVFGRQRTRGDVSKALFLVCIAAWGIVTAYVYDTVVIPVITS